MTTTTTNYGFVKPDVGASDDVWGGLINADLDSIDATVRTVSNTAMGDNRIINGDMRIDQRNNGSSGTATGYTIDRWNYFATQTSKGTWGRNTSAGSTALGFPYFLNFTSSSAYAAISTDCFAWRQPVEADMISDFAWGTASAQPVTLSFWAFSTLGGALSGSVRDYAGTRSYPFTYNLIANTWTKIVITIPGDTSGSWVMSGNGGALYLWFDLGNGTSFRGPAGAWASVDYRGVSGSVSTVGTNGAAFNLTGVKLEIGSVATPFNRQSLAKSLADCQRYYQVLGNTVLVSGYNAAANNVLTPMSFPVAVRASPTAVYSSTSYGNASALVSNSATANMIVNQCTVTGVGSGYAVGLLSLSAEL